MQLPPESTKIDKTSNEQKYRNLSSHKLQLATDIKESATQYVNHSQDDGETKSALNSAIDEKMDSIASASPEEILDVIDSPEFNEGIRASEESPKRDTGKYISAITLITIGSIGIASTTIASGKFKKYKEKHGKITSEIDILESTSKKHIQDLTSEYINVTRKTDALERIISERRSILDERKLLAEQVRHGLEQEGIQNIGNNKVMRDSIISVELAEKEWKLAINNHKKSLELREMYNSFLESLNGDYYNFEDTQAVQDRLQKQKSIVTRDLDYLTIKKLGTDLSPAEHTRMLDLEKQLSSVNIAEKKFNGAWEHNNLINSKKIDLDLMQGHRDVTPGYKGKIKPVAAAIGIFAASVGAVVVGDQLQLTKSSNSLDATLTKISHLIAEIRKK